jgi:hypoxanthine phosphoribosyltransferase
VQSYDYAHRQGIRLISWEDFAALGAQLAESLDRSGVEVIVGIARAGLFPAALAACSLRLEMFPARLTRRLNDQVIHSNPVWRVPLTADLSGKVVAVVDEIADTGQTLEMAAHEARRKGAASVRTACLVRHSWADPLPDFSCMVTDELVIFPWDQKVLIDGRWQPHPEIVAAIQAQPGAKKSAPTPKSAATDFQSSAKTTSDEV